MQHFANDDDCVVGLLPLFEFDGFANGWNCFDRVTSVEAGRVDLMLEPRAIGQALGGEKFSLAFDEQRVHFGERRGCERGVAVGDRVFVGFVIFGSAVREHVGGISSGAKFKYVGTVSDGGAASGSFGSVVAVNTPSSSSRLRSSASSRDF